MKRSVGILLLLVLLVGVFPVRAEQPAPIQHATINGMKVMLQQTKSELTEVTLLLKSGSGLDPKGKRGTALLMNFLVEQILAADNKEYGDYSISTYPDYTVINFSTTASDLKLVLQEVKYLLTSPLYHYDFINDLIELYSSEVIAAPVFGKAYAKVGALMYGANHPYNEELTPESIKAIRGEDVYRWYRKTYQPGNAILSITGGGDIDIKQLQKFFTPMLSETLDQRLLVDPVFPEKNKSVDYVDPNGRIATLCMGYPAPRIWDPEYPAFNVLVYYLENFQHYFEELRVKEGLMYSEFIYYTVLEKPKAPNLVFMTMTDRESIPLVEERTVRLLQNLAQNGIEQKQIDGIVRVMKAEIKKQTLSGEGQALRNALSEYLQTRLLYGQNYLDELEKVKTEDIKAAVAKYFKHYVRVAYIPEKKAKNLYH